jgi:hypothetical protein
MLILTWPLCMPILPAAALGHLRSLILYSPLDPPSFQIIQIGDLFGLLFTELFYVSQHRGTKCGEHFVYSPQKLNLGIASRKLQNCTFSLP